MKIALVVAAAKNGVIGARGKLPWKLRNDLKWFKQVTIGKPIVMGRKTFESIGKPLPGRDNIVVTRRPGWSAPGVAAAASIDEAIALAGQFARAEKAEEICIIGGGEIYRETIDRADRIYLTEVAASVAGDAFFPEINPGDWRISVEGGAGTDDSNDYDCRFLILDRIKRPSAEG